ncbi:hypothetical protein CLI72_07960 [Porphyromonas gingivalis]|uniref:hypothetical protein n=1 Tax=Porphyromonas gingivalis TaxID=837 RepID=UPI000BE77188|nr:hypothetical protein [Porphyromonas gingivalis]PDP73309.1 hypothetical protein CLI81_05055 [Porphyromonas gingivalis]PDP77360.1 hypothetical protein CLI76_04545 [Porphyromonas gingivalis]PDP80746.1 hypothetical protein CLI72_07960 [Porphyromonas gingivalis]RRG13514.1 hypothetical protein DOE52_06445 [Porphyromonas gingivalis]
MKKIKVLLLIVFLAISSSIQIEAQQINKTSVEETNTLSSFVEKRDVNKFLEVFCREYYNSCFKGRTYVQNSLSIVNFSVIDENNIRASGTHSYRGRFGVLYDNYDFSAIITLVSSGIKIEFRKRSAPDLFNDDYYWETCDRVIRI